MKNAKAILILTALIGILALAAASAGLFWPGEGQPRAFQNERGDTVMLQNRGLYAYDSASGAAQEQANDFVTLVLGLPLLIVSTGLALRGSLRGRLLLAGTLGFFLYTYMSMTFNTAFNPLFLLYVILFSLSLYDFILVLLTFDLAALPAQFSPRLPRGWIAGTLFGVGVFLTLAWLGRIGQAVMLNQTPAGMDNYTTLVIQGMDLGLIVPLSVLSGVLLLRRSAWGYLLASVAVMKFITMGAAVSAMGINMARTGAAISIVELVIFPLLTLINLGAAYLLLQNIQARPGAAAVH